MFSTEQALHDAVNDMYVNRGVESLMTRCCVLDEDWDMLESDVVTAFPKTPAYHRETDSNALWDVESVDALETTPHDGLYTDYRHAPVGED